MSSKNALQERGAGYTAAAVSLCYSGAPVPAGRQRRRRGKGGLS